MIAVIPARKDSRGIPGKNLRLYNGKPLFLNTALKLREAGAEQIVVATDDPTVASVARINGLEVHWRNPVDADQTLAELVEEIDRGDQQVGTFQCTCPNVEVETYQQILQYDGPLVTVVAPTHLYRKLNGKPIGKPANRQQLYLNPRLWQETGVAKLWVGEGRPALHEVSQHEALDLDTAGDWAQLQAQNLADTVVEWRLASDLETGSGHTRRFLALYRSLPLMAHRVRFTDPDSWLAQEVRDNVGPEVSFETEATESPRLAIWDQLEVPYPDAREYFGNGVPQLALESEGPGLEYIQAQLDEFTPVGRLFAVVRPEFSAVPPLDRYQIDNILVTFGGTDPENYTKKTVELLADLPVNKHFVVPNSQSSGRPMVELMAEADLVICSAGRTVYEAVVAGRPVIKVPVNNRERRHDHGYGVWQSDLAHLADVVREATARPDLLQQGVEMARRGCDGRGAERLADLIVRMVDA